MEEIINMKLSRGGLFKNPSLKNKLKFPWKLPDNAAFYS
jgi:hypothetical protein